MVHHAPQESSPPRRRRGLWWSLAVLLLVAVALVLGLVLSPGGPGTAGPEDTQGPTSQAPSPTTSEAPTPTDDPSASPSDDPSDDPASGSATPSDPPASSPPATSTPSDGASPTAPGELDQDDAAAVVGAAVEAPLTEAETTDDLDDVLADIAIEGYAAELEAQWLELTSQGWSITGTPTVAALEITTVDASADPVTAEVLACLDSADVTTVDADGEPIGDPSATMTRALHHFTMVQGDDGIWRLSEHTFPDDPSC